jgi:SAM-dependent methyltransferase
MQAAFDRRPSSLLRSIGRRTGLLAAYFRLIELRRAMTYPKPPRLAPDGRPLPSRLAMMRIGGGSDWRFFYDRGRLAAETLVAAARQAGAHPETWTRVLDWGCGCGRIARHMPSLTPARILGRDIDALTVGWCARHLDGDFRVSSLKPPLDIDAASIDFAYGYSVLTHLTGPMQAAWLAELGRVLKPGALAVLTYHDLEHPAVSKVAFRGEAEGVWVTEWAMEGSNLTAAFQDAESIRRAAAPWFDLVRDIPRRDTPFDQSVVVLRRTQTFKEP